MSKFYVGQRVRIVKARNPANRSLIGVETVIARIGLRAGEVRGPYVLGLDVDCELAVESIAFPCSPAVMNFDQLEPLTDPGREVVSWETCEWKPPHMREVTA